MSLILCGRQPETRVVIFQGVSGTGGLLVTYVEDQSTSMESLCEKIGGLSAYVAAWIIDLSKKVFGSGKHSMQSAAVIAVNIIQP
ncbi:MAG: hypothetical protein ACE5KD_02830 [Candidatus Bathyarchaeia archaeon]